MFIVDSHCHLDFEVLQNDLPGVLSRMEEAGVGLAVTIGTRIRRFPQILKIADENANVFCTVGTHPHNAHEELDILPAEIVRLADHPKVIGIGECGLDYHYKLSTPAAQEQGFRQHIEAARETGLPLVIHTREAEADTIRILESEMNNGTFKPLLHCFTSDIALARAGVAMGCHVSFSGILTYKSAANLREAAAVIPMDRLLVETDAPYLAPVPYRGKDNEPAFVVKTLETLAQVKGVTVEAMARQTSENFFRLFSKAPVPAAFARAA